LFVKISDLRLKSVCRSKRYCKQTFLAIFI
jgi:hypothetical protein